MNFLYPAFLWGFVGLALPLLIHLFSRKKAKPMQFSTIRFLKLSKTKSGKKQKIEEIFILLLRTALLAMLIFAIAAPVSKSFSLFSKERYFVFIIDDSFSMTSNDNGSIPFERMKKEVTYALSKMRRNSKVSLVQLSGEVTALSTDFDRIGQKILNMKVSSTSGSLPRSITESIHLLRKKSGIRTIFFFTDFQKYPWQELRQIRFPEVSTKFILVDLGHNNKNNVGFRNMQLLQEKKPSVHCTVKNWYDREVTSGIVLTHNNVETRRPLTIEPQDSNEELFPIKTAGKLKGVIEYPDTIKIHNYRYFAPSAPEKMKVLVIADGNLKSTFYITKCFEALGDFEKLQVDVKTLNTIQNTFLQEYGTIVFSNIGRVPPALARNVMSYVSNGGNVLYFLGNRVIADSFNSDWNIREENMFLMPARIGKQKHSKHPLKISWVETRHPVFILFRNKIFQYLKPVSFSAYFETKDVSGNVLAKLSGNTPVLLEKKIGNGHVILFPFAINENWTNLHLKSFYPVLMNNILRYASSSSHSSITAGQNINVPVPPETSSVEIITPDGKTRSIKPREKYVNVHFFCPGFWKIRFLKKTRSLEKVFAVNVDWEEGNPEKITLNEIKRMLPGPEIHYVRSSDFQKFLIKRELSSDLSDLFLNFALVLLLAEIIASNILLSRKISQKP